MSPVKTLFPLVQTFFCLKTNIMERESMVFYRSFLDTILKIDNPEVGYELFVAVTSYSLYGIEPKLTGMSDAFWTLIKPQLDANLRKYENGKKGARHGIKGGRPKTPKKPLNNPKETPKLTPKKPLDNPKLTPNVNVNVNDNVNGNVNVNENVNINKDKNIFSFENLTDKHNQIKRDFQIDSFPKLRRNKELNKSFLMWLIYRKADSLFEVEMHLKAFIKLVKDRFTTESIILAVDHAILNKHLSIHPTEKLKTSGYQFPSKGPIPPGT